MRMAERIDLLKDHLPGFLVNNKKLYRILSLGIHELNEADCLGFFSVIRQSTVYILEEDKRKKEELAQRKAVEAGLQSSVLEGQGSIGRASEKLIADSLQQILESLSRKRTGARKRSRFLFLLPCSMVRSPHSDHAADMPDRSELGQKALGLGLDVVAPRAVGLLLEARLDGPWRTRRRSAS